MDLYLDFSTEKKYHFFPIPSIDEAYNFSDFSGFFRIRNKESAF